MLTYQDLIEQGFTCSKQDATLLQAKISPIALYGHPESNEVFPAAVNVSKVEPVADAAKTKKAKVTNG